MDKKEETVTSILAESSFDNQKRLAYLHSLRSYKIQTIAQALFEIVSLEIARD